MAASNIVTYFIILASATTLYAAGKHDIKTAEQLALALRPFAGDAATVLMALGLIGTGVLAVPILTTSAAYAVAEAFRWRRGLDHAPSHAKEFYVVIVLSTLAGMELNFLGISPVDVLYWTSLIYGFLTPPLLIVIVLIASNQAIMGDRVNRPVINVIAWIAIFLATAAAVAMLLT
mgnify:FL=1